MLNIQRDGKAYDKNLAAAMEEILLHSARGGVFSNAIDLKTVTSSI